MTATPSDARARVLSAAVDLFAEHGYDATSVAQVIARAGVAKGGFYHHFASKQDLLSEIYGDLIETQLAAMRAILALGHPPAETLRLLIHDLVISTTANIRPARVFVRDGHRIGDERRQALQRSRRAYHSALTDLIAEAQRTGEFAAVASAETVTFTVFGVVNELPRWYRPRGRTTPARLAGELADLMLAALSVREAA